MYQPYPPSGQAGPLWAIKHWAAVLGPLTVLCLLAACSSAAGTSPASSRSFTSEADQVVADLAAGNYTAVEGKFDSAMMQASQTVPLPKAWAACQHYLGTYRSHGTPVFARQGQFINEQVPVAWANGPGVVVVTFDPSGTIAGLHCYGQP